MLPLQSTFKEEELLNFQKLCQFNSLDFHFCFSRLCRSALKSEVGNENETTCLINREEREREGERGKDR